MSDSSLLTAIEAALLSAATDGYASISIAGRTVTRLSLKELADLRADVEERIAIAASGENGVGNVLVNHGGES